MEKIYNKLVRDNIPDVIRNDNEIPITRVLNDEEYKVELEKKLMEECGEVVGTRDPNDRCEELADVIEVISSLASLENQTLDAIIEIAKQKKIKRGGFEGRIYLEKSLIKDKH